jgi:hypothetical protein
VWYCAISGAKSITVAGGIADEMNDGENSVFPIQVSHWELLLFLGAVIFIGIYQSTALLNAQSFITVNKLQTRPNAVGKIANPSPT